MNLTQTQKEKISKIARSHKIKMMVVFGSQVHSKTHPGSDLDIGILLNQEPQSYHILLDVQGELKKVFPDYKLDVSYLHRATPYFLFESVYKGQLLYGSNYDYTKLCAQAFKQYIDSQELRDLRDEMIQRKQIELLNKSAL